MPGPTTAAPAGGHRNRWIGANSKKALAELDRADVNMVFDFVPNQVDPVDLTAASPVILQQE